jgi:putative endonuclease
MSRSRASFEAPASRAPQDEGAGATSPFGNPPHREERRASGASRTTRRIEPPIRAKVAAMTGASIYILLCADGSYYTGVTRRAVEERVSEHEQGLLPGYTFTRRPLKLVFSEPYVRVDDAIAAERRIKGWSRAKKEAYMRGDFASLVALAKRGAKTRR